MSLVRRTLALVILLAVCLGAGALGASVTTPAIDGWYRTLAKPEWTPPDAVFGPVWTTLYVLMAIAAWLAWRPIGRKGPSSDADEASGNESKRSDVAVAMSLFAVQLALNVGWSWVFFGMREPGWAVVEIVVLWLAIAATGWAFARRSRLAGGLMLPYLAWVSFAAALNFAIWRLNAG